jgi:hypothetical protein
MFLIVSGIEDADARDSVPVGFGVFVGGGSFSINTYEDGSPGVLLAE